MTFRKSIALLACCLALPGACLLTGMAGRVLGLTLPVTQRAGLAVTLPVLIVFGAVLRTDGRRM